MVHQSCRRQQFLRRTFISAFLFAGSVLSVQVAAAQDTAADQSEGFQATLGLGIAAFPEYEGSDDYRILPIPNIDLRYGRFFANLGDGIGVDLVQGEKFQLGVSSVFLPGRRRRDVPEGVGRIESAPGAKVFGRYSVGDVSFTGAVTLGFGGTDATLVDVGVSYRLVVGERLMVMPGLGAQWANGKHMRRYFGINAEQSARSGLPVFDADSGIKNVSATLMAVYPLGQHWQLSGMSMLNRYTGDAADSPLTQRRWQPMGMIALGYRF